MLTSVILSYCRVTDDGVRVLAGAPALALLYLTGCSLVSDAGVLALGAASSLTDLDLSYCPLVTDEGLLALGTLPVLARVGLFMTQLGAPLVTDEGVARLWALLGSRKAPMRP